MRKLVICTLAAAAMLATQPLMAAARVAVLHLAPFAATPEGTAVDIAINGEIAFENVLFTDFVDYVELDAGDYAIDVIPVGATEPALADSFTLVDGMDYSILAIGDGVNQDLQLIAIQDDNTAPMAGNVAVRVYHAAPFAMDPAATEVSVRTDGGDVVNGLVGVPYTGNSGFFELAAGTYNLKIASNDGSVNYIDPAPAALPAGANVTLYATGDGINQPLGILAFPVGVLDVNPPVDNSANGWWNILEGSGQGFILQPVPSQNRLVGTWYTYDETGAPLFLTFDSCQEDNGEEGSFECSTPGAFDGQTAETALFLSTGGGSEEGLEVLTERIGTIEFDIGCEDTVAVVTLDGSDPETFNGKPLTQPFPCTITD
ncbi:MAG TPA: DUF4397 domain-containing protein [Xanthomonadales bacterium]|nr:DUF4397 domain-containing protein [Xanthomonadales bacterium]